MPEIERPVDELYKDESLQDLSSDATNYNNKVESLNTDCTNGALANSTRRV